MSIQTNILVRNMCLLVRHVHFRSGTNIFGRGHVFLSQKDVLKMKDMYVLAKDLSFSTKEMPFRSGVALFGQDHVFLGQGDVFFLAKDMSYLAENMPFFSFDMFFSVETRSFSAR